MSEIKYNQGDRVYFRLGENKPEGWGIICGDYDLLLILQPDTPLNKYSHIYVSKTQIVKPPTETETVPKVVEAEG